MSESRGKTIRNLVNSKINRILKSQNEPMVKSELAELRKGIGGIPGDRPELWWSVFEDFPEQYMSDNDTPSKEEWSFYIALTLFAMHQQGHDVEKEPMHVEGIPFGQAVRRLAPPGDEDALARVRRRFNIVATSSDISELSYHLRGIIQLMRSAGIPLDYGLLADNLYHYQFPDRVSRVRLKWGQDFYRRNANEESNKKKAQQ